MDVKGGGSGTDVSRMRLVACQSCHAQYDVSDVSEKFIDCRCGERVENKPLPGVDAQVHRCASCGAIVASDVDDCGYCGSEILRDPSRDLSLICPSCYGRNADGARFCVGCGVPFRPEKYQVEGFELPCPSCECLMPARSIAGIGINECGSCNGIWAPEQRFDLLVAKAIEARQSADPAKLAELKPRTKGGNPARQKVMYRKCPVCNRQMARSNFRKSSGVITDRCNEHGTWLDADELEQIAGFVLSGGCPGTSNFRARTEEDMKRARAAAEFRREIAAQDGPFRTPADGPMGIKEPSGILGSIFRFLTKAID